MKSAKLDKIILSLAIILLAGQFILQIFLANRDAQTTDESVHLLAGYTYLVKHDFRFNPEHPVLVKLLAAAPLLQLKPNLPADFDQLWDKSSDFYYDNWAENRKLAEEFLYQSGNNAEKLLFWGRVPIVFLTLMLGISILVASWKFFSPKGALLATALYVFNPVVTAHGHLITTDIAISLGFFLAILALFSFFKKQTIGRFIWLILALSFAFLVKFTAIILIPTILILFVYAAISGIIKRHEIVRVVLYLVATAIISWIIIFACYQFKAAQIPKVDSISQTMIQKNAKDKKIDLPADQQSKFDKVLSVISPALIPRDYFKGLFMVFTHVEAGHDSFLLGKFSKVGWWYYFPVVFVAKNPIPFLIVLIMAVSYGLMRKKGRNERLFFIIAALSYLLFAMTSKANLGVRHILPIFPVLIFICAAIVAIKDRVFRIAIIILMGWLVFCFVRVYPYYLSYFNDLFGGSKNGYKTASDSNLDWGRDLKEISSYLKSRELSPLYVEYFWNGLPSYDYYGIKSLPTSAINKSTTGYLVIGGSAIDSPRYSWLDSLPIYDRITPSVFVYKLTGSENE